MPEPTETAQPVREKVAEPPKPFVPRPTASPGILDRVRRLDLNIAKIYRHRSGQ